MQGVGAKLSKHVLGMKFMRKTKDQLDKDKVEKTHREHFAVDIKSEVDSTTTTTSQTSLTAIVEEVPSYSQCIGYNFGRVSFGGFNPIVEYNVSRGIWKAAKAGVPESDPEDEAKSEDALENDVPDEEMARTYGSIVGTLGKHFMNKRDRNTDEELKNDTRQGNNNTRSRRNRGNRSQTSRSETGRESQGAKKQSGWKKGRDWKKSQNNNSPTDQDQGRPSNNNQPGRSGSGRPPQKKAKFWKPAD